MDHSIKPHCWAQGYQFQRPHGRDLGSVSSWQTLPWQFIQCDIFWVCNLWTCSLTDTHSQGNSKTKININKLTIKLGTGPQSVAVPRGNEIKHVNPLWLLRVMSRTPSRMAAEQLQSLKSPQSSTVVSWAVPGAPQSWSQWSLWVPISVEWNMIKFIQHHHIKHSHHLELSLLYR